jgi:hypothetical protein
MRFYKRREIYSPSERLIYKTIYLPVVLYGWETWSLTLREEHRLRVFENRVLRTIFKEDEMGRAYSTNGGEEECI